MSSVIPSGSYYVSAQNYDYDSRSRTPPIYTQRMRCLNSEVSGLSGFLGFKTLEMQASGIPKIVLQRPF